MERKPTLSELITQAERERAERLRQSLKRAMARATEEYTTKRERWFAEHYPVGNPEKTPSPDELAETLKNGFTGDDLPTDYNDGSEADYE